MVWVLAICRPGGEGEVWQTGSLWSYRSLPATFTVTLRQWTSPPCKTVWVLGAWCHRRGHGASDSLTHGRVDRLCRPGNCTHACRTMCKHTHNEMQVTCKHTWELPHFMFVTAEKKKVYQGETKRGKKGVKCGGTASGIPLGFDRTNKSSQ